MLVLGVALLALGGLAFWRLDSTVLWMAPNTVGIVLTVLGGLALIGGIIRTIRRRKGLGSPSTVQRVRALPRMLRAMRQRRYPAPPWSKRLFWIAGIIYIISPIDLLPEVFLPIIGLTDDVGLGAFLLAQLRAETGRFVEAERGRPVPPLD
ncbi:YkvA family protein [Crossiella sp. CA198]|uniref:YkvA family protein n=1 Tax=Crossiella sp. CA198 TaxID=3455607 RepID=UPI003F8D2527